MYTVIVTLNDKSTMENGRETIKINAYSHSIYTHLHTTHS